MALRLFLILLFCVSCHAQRFIRTVSTIPQLLATNPRDVHTNVFVVGRTAMDDGGGGIFTIIPDDGSATNRGTIFRFTSDGTYLAKRVYDDTVNAKWFGITGTDDTAALQDAIYVARGKRLFLPAGTYAVGATQTPLFLTNNTYIEGTENTVITNLSLTNTSTFVYHENLPPGTPPYPQNWYKNSTFATNITIRNLTLTGSDQPSATNGYYSQYHIWLVRVGDFTLDNVRAFRAAAGALIGYQVTNLVIRNCVFGENTNPHGDQVAQVSIHETATGEEDNSSGIRIENTCIRNAGTKGIVIDQGIDYIISGIFVTNIVHNGIEVAWGPGVVANCIIDGVRTNNVYESATGLDIENATNVVVTSCLIQNSQLDGGDVYLGQQNTLRDCVFLNNSRYGFNAVTSPWLIMDGLRTEQNGWAGISIYNCDGFRIRNYVSRDNGLVTAASYKSDVYIWGNNDDGVIENGHLGNIGAGGTSRDNMTINPGSTGIVLGYHTVTNGHATRPFNIPGAERVLHWTNYTVVLGDPVNTSQPQIITEGSQKTQVVNWTGNTPLEVVSNNSTTEARITSYSATPSPGVRFYNGSTNAGGLRISGLTTVLENALNGPVRVESSYTPGTLTVQSANNYSSLAVKSTSAYPSPSVVFLDTDNHYLAQLVSLARSATDRVLYLTNHYQNYGVFYQNTNGYIAIGKTLVREPITEIDLVGTTTATDFSLEESIRFQPIDFPTDTPTNLNLSLSYNTILVNSRTNAIQLTLPASSSANRGLRFWIKDVGGAAATNYISLAPTGADKIDGSNSRWHLMLNNQSVAVIDGGDGNWYLQ